MNSAPGTLGAPLFSCLLFPCGEEGEGRLGSEHARLFELGEEILRKGGKSGGEVSSKPRQKYAPTTKTSEKEFFSWGLKGKTELQLPSQAARRPSLPVSLGPYRRDSRGRGARSCEHLAGLPPANSPWMAAQQPNQHQIWAEKCMIQRLEKPRRAALRNSFHWG